MPSAIYDTIGRGYRAVRHEDPRIATAIAEALTGCDSVVNVGAGAGSYEPRGRRVVAVEPSQEMIRQRRSDAAPCIVGTAESLPFVDDHFDAALAILTLHHWRDVRAGLAQMRRVARRVVILTWDPAAADRFWLTNDYFPEFIAQDRQRFPALTDLTDALGPGTRSIPVPIPHDCCDGFLGAYWRRPQAYLDPELRRGISSFCQADPGVVERGLARLASDLDTGAWRDRHGSLMDTDSLDLGYRIVRWTREA